MSVHLAMTDERGEADTLCLSWQDGDSSIVTMRQDVTNLILAAQKATCLDCLRAVCKSLYKALGFEDIV